MAAFTQIFVDRKEQYLPGSPVIIKAAALLRSGSGQVIGQLKFGSVSEKEISAVVVQLNIFDVLGAQIAEREFQYLNVNAPTYAEFGDQTPIMLEQSEAQSFTASLKYVVFGDKSVWNNESGARGEPLPPPRELSVSKQLLDTYHRELNNHKLANGVQTHGGLWQCGCGAWNIAAHESCRSCHAKYEKQLKYADDAVLQPIYDTFTAEQERIVRENAEFAARKRAEEEAQSKLEAAARAKARKKRKIVSLTVTFLVIAAVAAMFVFKAHTRSKNYEAAVAALESGSYSEAYNLAAALEDYENAPDIALESARLLGDEYMAAGDYENAAAAYMNAGMTEQADSLAYLAKTKNADSIEPLMIYNDEVVEGVFIYTTGGDSGFLFAGETVWATDSVYYDRASDYDKEQGILAFIGPDNRGGFANLNTGKYYDLPATDGIEIVNGAIKYEGHDGKDYTHEYGLVDFNGERLLSASYEDIRYYAGSDIAAIRKDGKWGYYNFNSGHIAYNIYDDAGPMIDGYAIVHYVPTFAWNDDYYIVLNSEGINVKAIYCDYIDLEGLCYSSYTDFEQNDKCGLIDHEGSYIVPAQYDNIDNSRGIGDGLVYVSDWKNPVKTAGYIDMTGKMVIDLKKMDVYNAGGENGKFENGLAPVSAILNGPEQSHTPFDSRFNVINTNGDLLFKWTKCEYILDEYSFFWLTDDIFAWYERYDEIYYLYRDGEVTTLGASYNGSKTITVNGLRTQSRDGLWGYVNDDGEFVIEPAFTDANPFIYETTFVQDGDEYLVIDMQGNVLLDNFVPAGDGTLADLSFINGYAVIIKDGERRIINMRGEIVF